MFCVSINALVMQICLGDKIMNHKHLLYGVLIIGLAGCAKKNRTTIIKPSSDTSSKKIDGYIAPAEGANIYDEDLESFVLEDEVNPLSGETVEFAEDISAENAQNTALVDDHQDSSKHGLKTIYFDFDNYDLRDDQKGSLEHDLKIVKDVTSKGNNVVIEGHACNFAGSSDYNMMLSEKRANKVASKIKDYLVSRGIHADRLKTVGRGCTMPLVPNGGKEQQSPNRRVEFYVISPRKTL